METFVLALHRPIPTMTLISKPVASNDKERMTTNARLCWKNQILTMNNLVSSQTAEPRHVPTFMGAYPLCWYDGGMPMFG